MSTVEESIDVDVPIRTAYDQWTQFEEFPNFMKDVEEVRQIDDTHLTWRANIAGKPVEWSMELDRLPEYIDELRAAREMAGDAVGGAVPFRKGE